MLHHLPLTALILIPAHAYLCNCPPSADCDIILQPSATVISIPPTPTENDNDDFISVILLPHFPTTRARSTSSDVPWCIFSSVTVPRVTLPPTRTSEVWPTILPTGPWIVIPTDGPGLGNPEPSDAMQTGDVSATATAIPSPAPSDDGGTANEHKEVKTMGAIPALWAILAVAVVVFFGWMCWEVWNDIREMIWLEAELKRQRKPLLEDEWLQRFAWL